jgi:hypothetical protein
MKFLPNSVKSLLIAFLLGVSIDSGAALVQRDLATPGDGLITYDSGTELSWLDLTATVGQGYNEVAGGFGGFTTALGFRYATAVEVGRLFSDAGVAQGGWVWGYWNFGNPGYVANSTLVSLLGATHPFDGLSTYAMGLTGSNTFGTLGFHDVAAVGYNNHADYVALLAATSTDDSQGTFDAGSFLVKETVAVPEPETYAMLLAGLGLLGFREWSRKQQA